jgi:phage/plasmid-associated DNA primase
MFTKAADVHFIAEADRDQDKWKAMHQPLFNISCEDQIWLDFLQKVVGYALTGETYAQKFFVFLGIMGSNGKGFLLRIFKSIMAKGSYITGNKDAIIENKRAISNTEGPSPGILRLKTGRTAICSEIKPGDAFQCDTIKRWTGEDDLTGRGLNADPEDFKTQNKLFLMLNVCARWPADDAAFMRRIVIFLFEALFVETEAEVAKRKAELVERAESKLEEGEEESGIPQFSHVYLLDGALEKRLTEGDLNDYFFSWAVDGAARFYREGLKDSPARVAKGKRLVMNSMDQVQLFLHQDQVKVHTKDIKAADRLGCSELHVLFLAWSERVYNRESKIPLKALNADLRSKGFVTRTVQGRANWTRISTK